MHFSLKPSIVLHQIKCFGQWRKSESIALWFMIYDLWKLYGKDWSPTQALGHQDPELPSKPLMGSSDCFTQGFFSHVSLFLKNIHASNSLFFLVLLGMRGETEINKKVPTSFWGLRKDSLLLLTILMLSRWSHLVLFLDTKPLALWW